ncbi:hypothetical protein [Nonomuraea dietziae]|uniref:hypothetical protein n=1 Tax=Nonomuraea dietziae TaxID=65515 RepID=UPI0031D5F06E
MDGPLSAASFAEAVRRGRTFATTGPWLELSVEGHGPGAVLDLERGARVEVTARTEGPAVEELRLRTADGVVAVSEGPVVSALAGAWRGHLRPGGGGGRAFARVDDGPDLRADQPVHLDVEGRRVARREDVLWCLEWLEALEDLVRGHAVLHAPGQLGRPSRAPRAGAREVYRARLSGV